MDLDKAIAAVTSVRDGKKVYGFDYDAWTQAEHILRQSGKEDLAIRAHQEAIRSYRKEEWDAGLL